MNQLVKKLRFVGKTIVKVPSETNMGKYKKHRRRNTSRSQKITKEDKLHLMIIGIVFVVCFVFYLMSSFVSNCIFEWPLRWDIGTCWNEQVGPAKEKAVEKAIQFVP